MTCILVYKEAAGGKYILFQKVPLNGEKKYTLRIRRAHLNKEGKTNIKIVVMENGDKRETLTTTLPQ